MKSPSRQTTSDKPLPRFFVSHDQRGSLACIEFVAPDRKVLHRTTGAKVRCSGYLSGAEVLAREGIYEEITPEQARDRISKAQRRAEEEPQY